MPRCRCAWRMPAADPTARGVEVCARNGHDGRDLTQTSQVPAPRVDELTPRAYKENAEAAGRAANACRDLASVVASLKFAP